MRSLEQVNIRTNVRTYILTYIRTGQTLYPLHNFVVRGDNEMYIYANFVGIKPTDGSQDFSSLVKISYICPHMTLKCTQGHQPN